MKVLTVQLDVSDLTEEEINELQESFESEFDDDIPILNIGVRVIDPSDYEDENEGRTLQ